MQGSPSSLDHPLRDPVRLELRLLVVGGELRAGVLVGLVDHLAVGVAEDAAGGDVDDPRSLRLEGRLEDAFGPGDVRLVHRRVLGGRDPDLVHRGGVDRRVAALEAGADRCAVAEVAGDELTSHRESRSPFSGLRTRQTTSSPRSRSCRTTVPPMKPVPPVTKTLTNKNPILG